MQVLGRVPVCRGREPAVIDRYVVPVASRRSIFYYHSAGRREYADAPRVGNAIVSHANRQ